VRDNQGGIGLHNRFARYRPRRSDVDLASRREKLCLVSVSPVPGLDGHRLPRWAPGVPGD
jgi:hypothetical protein